MINVANNQGLNYNKSTDVHVVNKGWFLFLGIIIRPIFFKSEFANDCNLRISPEEEKILYLEHVNKELPRIPYLVPNFNKLSDNKKLLIMDMVYNLGYDGFKKNFPNFIEGAKANSTKEMLKHYHRTGVGFDRNDWARKLLEEDLKNNR